MLLQAGRESQQSTVLLNKAPLARIIKHEPKIRSQMFQFSWRLFLEMKKLNIRKYKFSSLFNYLVFSLRQDDTEENIGLIISRPEFYSSSAKSCVNSGSAI